MGRLRPDLQGLYNPQKPFLIFKIQLCHRAGDFILKGQRRIPVLVGQKIVYAGTQGVGNG